MSMSIENLIWINTILLVFIAIRIHQIYENIKLDAQNHAEEEMHDMEANGMNRSQTRENQGKTKK